jgi:hypothetical protein
VGQRGWSAPDDDHIEVARHKRRHRMVVAEFAEGSATDSPPVISVLPEAVLTLPVATSVSS